MSEKADLYIHMYVSNKDARIAYQQFPQELSKFKEVGQSLLDFIYEDLSTLTTMIEQNAIEEASQEIRSIHPYFQKLHQDALDQFITNSQSSGEYNGDFCLKSVFVMQDEYRTLLESINSLDLHSDLLSTKSLYSRMKFAYLNKILVIDYFLLGLEECLCVELFEMIRRNLMIKICKNCGRAFVPKKSNVDYCYRIYTADGKTCQDVGYTQTFAKSVKNDDLLQAYTRAYKAHYARMTKPRKKAENMTREAFETWYTLAKEKLKLAREGKIDAEAYKQWLKK